MTDFDRKLYAERRKKGLRGQTGAVTVHAVVKDEKGEEKRIPLGNKVHNGTMNSRKASRRKLVDHKYTKKGFTGHIIGSKFVPPTAEMALTNHQRHFMRQQSRQKQEAYVSKPGAGR